MGSASADDNGAYLSKSTAKKYFVFNENMCRTVHLGNNCDWYVGAKDGKDYVKEFVSEKDIVELTRLDIIVFVSTINHFHEHLLRFGNI